VAITESAERSDFAARRTSTSAGCFEWELHARALGSPLRGLTPASCMAVGDNPECTSEMLDFRRYPPVRDGQCRADAIKERVVSHHMDRHQKRMRRGSASAIRRHTRCDRSTLGSSDPVSNHQLPRPQSGLFSAQPSMYLVPASPMRDRRRAVRGAHSRALPPAGRCADIRGDEALSACVASTISRRPPARKKRRPRLH